MRRVIIESPYAGNIELNLRYLRACMADCLRRGEAPFASHGLYTQPGVLRDEDPMERAQGINAGFAWRDVADATVAYTDLGISNGMQLGIEEATKLATRHHEWGRHTFEYRSLGGIWTDGGPKDCFGKPTLDESRISESSWAAIVKFSTSRWGFR
jgi:hypothetical protein